MRLEFAIVSQIIFLLMFSAGIGVMIFAPKLRYIGMGGFGLAMGLYGWQLIVLDVLIVTSGWLIVFGAVIVIFAIILQGQSDLEAGKKIPQYMVDDVEDIYEAIFAVIALIIALINGVLLFFTPVALETVSGIIMLTVSMALFLYIAGTSALNARRLNLSMNV